MIPRQAVHAGRERAAVSWLAKLVVARRDQLVSLAWPDHHPEAARTRLQRMVRAGLVDVVRGAAEGHSVYVLSSAGARAAAALAHDAALARYLARSAADTVHLPHRLATGDVVVELVRRLGSRLAVLHPHERRIVWSTASGRREVTPDAVLGNMESGWWLAMEYDRGTRSLDAIATQLARYAEAKRLSTAPAWARRGSIVYVLEDASRARAEAILAAAREAGIGDRVAVVALEAMSDLVERLVEVVT